MTLPPHRRPLVLLARGPLAASRCPYHRELGRRLKAIGCAIRFIDPYEGALRGAVDQLADCDSPIGICGSDTLANEALHAAAGHPVVGALIWRGGGSDDSGLHPIHCPVLLLASASNPEEIERALRITQRIGGRHLLERVVPPLDRFTDRGALERAARTACRWFNHHLIRSPALPATRNLA